MLFTRIIFFIIFSVGCLHAEIQKVVISWNPALCPPSCADGLAREFKRIPGVARVQTHSPDGQIELEWKKGVGFSFSPINVAMRMIGVSVVTIHIKVRGLVSQEGNRLHLTSSGDGTQFELINPPPSHQMRLRNEPAIEMQNFSDQLIQAAKNQKEISVEGRLFAPERNLPIIQMVVDSVSFEENTKEN